MSRGKHSKMPVYWWNRKAKRPYRQTLGDPVESAARDVLNRRLTTNGLSRRETYPSQSTLDSTRLIEYLKRDTVATSGTS
jgi:hypothetical protein